MSRRRLSNQSALLARPSLPQAVEGELDLSTLYGEAVRVSVPGYPQCNVGDRIMVTWRQHATHTEITRRYAYLPDGVRGLDNVQHEIRVRPLWALPPGDYEVQYAVTSRTGNVSQSATAHVTVVGTPRAPAVITGGVIQTDLFGVYAPGLIGAWIVPDAYSIESPNDILVQSLASFSTDGKSTANSVLRVYKNDDSNAFASIVCDAAGTSWTPSVDESTTLARGDLISVRLISTQDSALFLVLAV